VLTRIFDWPELPAPWLIFLLFSAGVIVGVYIGWPLGRWAARDEQQHEEK